MRELARPLRFGHSTRRSNRDSLDRDAIVKK
jgi:hypothetical protein